MTEAPLCRDPEGGACRFWKRCHESRRRVQHYAGLEGEHCWAYLHLIAKYPHMPRDPGEEAA